MVMDKIALALLIVGGLNWGCIGLFQFDLVAFACGGSASLISRIIYTVVGLSAVWCISLLFRDTTDRTPDAAESGAYFFGGKIESAERRDPGSRALFTLRSV